MLYIYLYRVLHYFYRGIYRAMVITLKKSKHMLGHQAYRLKVDTQGIDVLLTTANTD